MSLFILCFITDVVFLISPRPPTATRTDTLFPYTTLFRSIIAMSSYLIACGNLLDATGAPIKPNTSVFVVGNKIEFIGTAAEAVSFAEAQGPHDVIDASGKTVMPGLIAVPFHISSVDPTSPEYMHLFPPVEYLTSPAVHHATKATGKPPFS